MDALLTLAFALHKNPGVYALLLGSGTSTAAGILTGWDITQDLRRQIMSIAPEESIDENIGYDALIEALAKTRAERNAVLRSYFEPTPEEKERGLKVPSAAHRRIAQLVKDGYIKVIITTNFDRLMETALEEQGIVPVVLSSDDMIKGRQPIRHSRGVLIKLHGDYLDDYILNTAQELKDYSPEKVNLLAEIFNDYGLIICGWSATWDVALRNAINSATARRYTTYWMEPYELSDEGKRLAANREAEVISMTADNAFTELHGKVDALSRIYQQHPLAVRVAVERVKRLLPIPAARIELEDLLRTESNLAYENIDSIRPEIDTAKSLNPRGDFYLGCFENSYKVLEALLNTVATVAWYGDDRQAPFISSLIRRWGSPLNEDVQHSPHRKIPVVLLSYACALAAVSKEHWSYLNAAIPNLVIPRHNREESFFASLSKHKVFHDDIYRQSSRSDPISAMISDRLRPLFEQLISLDRDFYALFDLCELLLALLCLKENDYYFLHDALSSYSTYDRNDYLLKFWTEGGKRGNDWEFLKVFFDGKPSELETLLTSYQVKRIENRFSTDAPVYPDFLAAYRSGLGKR